MGIDNILDMVETLTAVVKARNERKYFWLRVLGIICGIAAVAAIAYGIYRFLTPDYFDDYDDDDDFDDDDFDDSFDDDFEDEEVAGAEA